MSAILKFVQIKNFRSIIDSGKFYVPADGITVLVGQNESGKTSIIDALEAFDSEVLDNEDRTNRSDPTEITCTFSLSKQYLQSKFSEHEKEFEFISKYINNDELELEIKVSFPPKETNGQADITSPFYTDYLGMLVETQSHNGQEGKESTEKEQI